MTQISVQKAGSCKNDPVASCLGQYQFRTPQDALKASRKTKTPTEIYRCGRCGNWHIGHAKKTRRRTKRTRQL